MTPRLLSAVTHAPLFAGFENVTNADVSRVAIHQMTETYKAYPMECEFIGALELNNERGAWYCGYLENLQESALEHLC